MIQDIFKKFKIELACLFFIAFSFVFKISLATPAILLLLLLNVSKVKNQNNNLTVKLLSLLFGSIYVLYILSFLFNYDSSTKLIVRSLGFIFIPGMFLVKKFSFEEIKFFIFSFLLLQLIHLLYVDFIVLQYQFFSDSKSFENFTALVENKFILERPYFSLNCLLSIFCIKFLLDNTTIKKVILYLFIGLIIFTLFIIAARLAMGVSVLLCFFIFLKQRKTVYFVGLVGVLFVMVFTNQYIIQRLTVEKGEPRIVIWKCAKGIVDEKTFNYFTGTFSSEQVDAKLIDCYNSKEVLSGPYWWIGKKNFKYNTHNQYIWYFVTYGFLGLTLFLGIFGVQFWNFIKNKNGYSFFFIFIFSSQSLFENLLSRQLGIYLFLWFCYLFVIRTENTIQDA
ncbi:hypothetical protein FLAPXU55_01247 [Flavobacterium panici]|uniref:O-antigen ligase n=1 Tax=Flavobacterium panici TaxID=2654843 RepID=A0A9N8P100_9FLAO|nr:hypothetical protein FLAPXU55_01247 [Flavobacterium panici]